MLGLEVLHHRRALAGRDLERGVGAAIAQVDARLGIDALGRQALPRELGAAFLGELRDGAGEPRHQQVVELGLDRALAQRAHVREPHAVGREHARQGMHEHALEAQRVRDPAGVLPRGAAEAAQHVARDLVAALDRDLLDRVRHVVDRDREAAVRDLLGGARNAGRGPDLLGERREALAHHPAIERLVGVRPEHLREEPRVQLADHQVGVGHGQAGRPCGSRRGRGWRQRNSGPTRKRAPSNTRIEPPPAATVWIAIIGARMRTPATSDSKLRSYSPA